MGGPSGSSFSFNPSRPYELISNIIKEANLLPYPDNLSSFLALGEQGNAQKDAQGGDPEADEVLWKMYGCNYIKNTGLADVTIKMSGFLYPIKSNSTYCMQGSQILFMMEQAKKFGYSFSVASFADFQATGEVMTFF